MSFEETNNDIESSQDSKPKKKPNRLLLALLGFAFLVVLGGAIGYWVNLQSISEPPPVDDPRPQYGVPRPNANTTSQPEPVKVDNPIDFGALQAINPDVHAWLQVPGTYIDYPVCQSLQDETFYLDHDLEGNYYGPGTLYTELMNSRTFSDPVTLIYGHAGYPDIMFTTLHYFNDTEFFNTHEYFTIYIPGHILTYKVVSAYVYDARHILNTHGLFLDKKVLAEYYNYVVNPDSMSKNIRDGVTLKPDDRIVQLSTCMENLMLSGNRYIVTGLLVDDQLTY